MQAEHTHDNGRVADDFYQLTMLDAYLREGMHAPAVFELFVRRLPPQRNYLVAAGLEQALDFLEQMAFGDAEIARLQRQGGFSRQLLDHLRRWRFEGDVHAMPEGTPFFADEPVLRVTAPLPQAQFVESRLLNVVHFQTLIASKAARIVDAAPGRQLVDFGMRRAHGAEAALFAARAAYLAGFDGTATAMAAMRFGIGTSLDTSSDEPAMDAVFKLQVYAGEPRRKRSEGKTTWPGAKQVARRFDADGRLQHDTVQLDGEPLPPESTPLLHPVMRGGRRLRPSPGLDAIRERHAAQMDTLPRALLDPAPARQPFIAEISARLQTLARQFDAAPH